MSIHSSLRTGGAHKKHRSVLKRHERLKMLKDKHIWDESKSVLGIPKVKMQKLKVRKEKTAEVAPGAPGQATAAPAAAAPAPAKGQGQKAEKK